MQLEVLSDGLLKKSLVGLLILVGVSVGALVFTPSPPDSVVSLNNAGDVIATVAATACGLLCCPGLLCIFIKKWRFPMLIITAFVLLLFLSAVCIDHAYENLNYAFSKDKTPVERPCVITHHKHNHSTNIREERHTGKDVFGNEKEYVTGYEETTDKYELKFRFLDGNKQELSISRDTPFGFYKRVYEGDTCVAYILTGALGIDYVQDMRVKKRAH